MIEFLKINTKELYSCGDLSLKFSGMIPNLVHLVVQIIWILVPILLVIFGLIDLAKAVMAQKEDEIKKGQQTLFKRAIVAVIVFFVIPVVRLIIDYASGADSTVVNCFNCFVNGSTENGCKSEGVDAGQLER